MTFKEQHLVNFKFAEKSPERNKATDGSLSWGSMWRIKTWRCTGADKLTSRLPVCSGSLELSDALRLSVSPSKLWLPSLARTTLELEIARSWILKTVLAVDSRVAFPPKVGIKEWNKTFSTPWMVSRTLVRYLMKVLRLQAASRKLRSLRTDKSC